MKEIPKNAKQFFDSRFKEVIFKQDWGFISRLEENTQLRQFIYPKLDNYLESWQEWERFLTLAVDCASLMQEENSERARKLKKAAEKLQREIFTLSEKLASKIDEINELGETGFIDTPYIGDSVEVVINAGKGNYLFERYLKENLLKSCRFDLKYFPTISDVVRVIGSGYSEYPIDFSYNYMDIGKRKSPRDFCIKLHLSIDKFIRTNSLPNKFKLTQSDIADFCNALLEVDISAENVKGYLAEFRKSQQKDELES